MGLWRTAQVVLGEETRTESWAKFVFSNFFRPRKDQRRLSRERSPRFSSEVVKMAKSEVRLKLSLRMPLSVGAELPLWVGGKKGALIL